MKLSLPPKFCGKIFWKDWMGAESRWNRVVKAERVTLRITSLDLKKRTKFSSVDRSQGFFLKTSKSYWT
jgi:hypothetical protein